MAESEAIQTAVIQADVQRARAAVLALREADSEPASGSRTANAGEPCRHRHGGSALRQPSFDWNAPDKFVELLKFEMEVANMLQTKKYRLNNEEMSLYLKNWLRRKGLQLIETFMKSEKEAYKTAEGLVTTLGKKLKPQHNKIILLLQYYKLKGKSEESSQEWMGRLQIKVTECKYPE